METAESNTKQKNSITVWYQKANKNRFICLSSMMITVHCSAFAETESMIIKQNKKSFPAFETQKTRKWFISEFCFVKENHHLFAFICHIQCNMNKEPWKSKYRSLIHHSSNRAPFNPKNSYVSTLNTQHWTKKQLKFT